MDRPVSSPIAPTVTMTAFTADQWEALSRLRFRSPRNVELFTPQELAHLRFLRWLYRIGRLDA